jgi:hypothetical protein
MATLPADESGDARLGRFGDVVEFTRDFLVGLGNKP